MSEYDRLPQELRLWLSSAMLPWRPRSVQAVYARALRRLGDADLAMSELGRIERNMIAKDARQIWGDEHPLAGR